MRVTLVRWPPHLCEKLPMCDDHFEVLRQRRQQPEFDWGQSDFLFVAACSPFFEIYDRIAETKDRRAGWRTHGVSQRRTHTREQLTDPERLGHVVVSARV